MGTVLFMALIGLILATIVNVFVASEALYWITTYAGVAIFAGLTAYDMQKIKGYAAAGLEGDAEQRASILGALRSTSTSSTSSSSCCGSSARTVSGRPLRTPRGTATVTRRLFPIIGRRVRD